MNLKNRDDLDRLTPCLYPNRWAVAARMVTFRHDFLKNVTMRGPWSLSPFTAAAHCSGAGQRQQRCYARLGNRLTLDRELRIAGISCIPSAFHMVEELRPGCCDPGPIGDGTRGIVLDLKNVIARIEQQRLVQGQAIIIDVPAPRGLGAGVGPRHCAAVKGECESRQAVTAGGPHVDRKDVRRERVVSVNTAPAEVLHAPRCRRLKVIAQRLRVG